MKTVLMLIATGERYWKYVRPLLQSADKFFVPHETFLFTDSSEDFGVFQINQQNLGFPQTTLRRYHSFLTVSAELEKYDYCFYVDIDAVFVDYVGQEIFSAGITATKHYNQNWYNDCLLEDRPDSAAFTQNVKNYYCGGFNGGTVREFIDMADAIREGVDVDSRTGIVAKWHDESHLNKYLSIYPPSRILSSDYCYPENELHKPNRAKIVCLEKNAWTKVNGKHVRI